MAVSNIAASSGTVIDDDRLPQRLGQGLASQASGHVHDTAWRHGYDDSDRSRRKVLRCRALHEKGRQRDENKFDHGAKSIGFDNSGKHQRESSLRTMRAPSTDRKTHV